MRYNLSFTPQARKGLLDLPRHVQKRVERWIDLLCDDPRREGTKKLEGDEDLRRVHTGKDYVIVYFVRDDQVLIVVVRVGHRKDVYRGL